MTQAAVAAQVHQTLDRHADLATQVTLNGVLGDFGAEALDFRLGQIWIFVAEATPAASQTIFDRVRPMP